MKPNEMYVYVICERSQTVTTAFRNMGVNAFSVDIEPIYLGFSRWHFKMDAFEFLYHLENGNVIHSQDGTPHTLPFPHLIIAHPPCTYLSNAGTRWRKNSEWAKNIPDAVSFFMAIWDNAKRNAPFVCVENPAGIMSTLFRKPDQYVNPWQFGEPFAKRTGLWLHNLPKLQPTKILERPAEGWQNQSFDPSGRNRGFGSKFRDPTVRSKTFPGIAEAMAIQWTNYICNHAPDWQKVGEKEKNQ